MSICVKAIIFLDQTTSHFPLPMTQIKNLVSAALLIFGGVVLCLAAPVTPALASEGMTAFNRKDYNEAYRIWRRNPESLESKYGMGRLHFEGLGGPQNTSKGLSLIDEASRSGYTPASEYLASHFERRGDFRSALRYLERLADRSPSIGVQKRLVAALSRTESKPNTKSEKYCTAVKTLAETDSGGDYKSDMQACALAGKSSTISQQAATEAVGARLTQAPSIEALETVASSYLNPDSANFNPQQIEEAVWALDEKLKNARIREILRKANVTFDRCTALPALSSDAKKTFNAYCTLAVIAGDSQPAKLMAMNYAYGKDGRMVDLARAAALIQRAPDVITTKEGLLITLTALSSEQNWRDHLQTMEMAGPRLIELEIGDLINQFVFQLEASSSKEYGQSDAAKLLKVASMTTQPDIHLAAFEQLKNKPKKNDFQPDDKEFIESLCSLEIKLSGAEKVCRSGDKGRTDPKALLSKRPSSLALRQDSSRHTNADQRLPNNTPSTANAGGINRAEQEIEQSLVQCDSGNLDACAAAAKTIMGKFPPRDYRDTSEDERKKIALRKLERAADGGAVSSLAMLYDLYSADLDSQLREKARKYLAVLETKNVPEGRLRTQLEILNVDPISGIFGAILDRSKYKEACINLKLLLQRRELNQDDEVKAMAKLDGAMCAAVK
jgi:TPR repeat protein